MASARLALPLSLVVVAMGSLSAQTRQPAPPAPAAEAPAVAAVRRVVVTAATASAYSCPDVTCRVVTALDKGAIVSVVKTKGDWHQVMVRLGETSMTTGWVKASQTAAAIAAPGAEASGSRSGSAQMIDRDPGGDADPRGCLTCLATRTPTRDEWEAALAETATRKATADDGRVTTGLADGRTSEERMRDRFDERYGPEVKRLALVANDVDATLQSYLRGCFQRFASIPVEGAAPRSSAVDDILKHARSSRGAARFALWNGTAAFQWNDAWAPQPDDSSPLPSCGRLWQDARSRAERLKIDLEFLERDAAEHDIFPGVVREMLAASGLAEGGAPGQAPPVPDVR
jgi:hypothetical protein